MPVPLNTADLSTAVRLTPLVSIDLIIRDSSKRVLLGLRTNEPAKGVYFVPGGRIWKDERIRDAFARILKSETNYSSTIDQARFRGPHEHFYQENRFGDPISRSRRARRFMAKTSAHSNYDSAFGDGGNWRWYDRLRQWSWWPPIFSTQLRLRSRSCGRSVDDGRPGLSRYRPH